MGWKADHGSYRSSPHLIAPCPFHGAGHCCLPDLFPFEMYTIGNTASLGTEGSKSAHANVPSTNCCIFTTFLWAHLLLAKVRAFRPDPNVLKPLERLPMGTGGGSKVPEQARCSTGRTSTNFTTPASQGASTPSY